MEDEQTLMERYLPERTIWAERRGMPVEEVPWQVAFIDNREPTEAEHEYARWLEAAGR